ncbi:hypothetical protein R1flu_027182 [Riccia fluitans]|uniref:Uncharacterized protein n=1 Tax=Riccia fluitans TaxID=41844 RepID=A0ABD1XIN1_9MARC
MLAEALSIMTTGRDGTENAEMLLAEKIFLLESSRHLQERIMAFNKMVGPEEKIISDMNLKDTLILSPEEKSESSMSTYKDGNSSSRGGSSSSKLAERPHPSQSKTGSVPALAGGEVPTITARLSGQIQEGSEWPQLGNQEKNQKQDRAAPEDRNGKRED